MAVLVERATSDLLIGPDWGLNLEICDAVNHNPSLSRDIVKALKKRLSNKNAKVQLLTLTVLEMVMKNCGDSIHQMVAEKDVLHDMVKIVKKKVDLAVRDKILALVESWQKAFGGPMAKYPQYSAAYEELRRSGVQFPIQSIAETVPMFTPSAATQTHSVAAAYTAPTLNTTRSLPQLAYGLPAFEPARLDEVLAASENSICSGKDLDGAQRTLEVLNEMLSALDPGEKQAVFNDVIGQLVEQCVTNQKIVQQMVNSTTDESMLFRGLSLNDDIQQVLLKHSSIVAKALSQAETTLESPPRGLTVYDNEDDEAEDEVSHLAHRSSSRSSRSSQENGLVPKNTHAPPVVVPITPSNASSLGQGNGAYGEGASLAASSGPVMPSRSHAVFDEEESMVNPFANTASIQAFPSNGSLSSATGSSSLSADSSKLAARQPSHYGKTFREPDSSAYKAPSQGLENIWASESRAQNQDYTSQALDSPFDDDDMVNPTASWKPAAKPETVSSLPPPPILSSARERFFEEKRQMYPSPKLGSLAPGSMERRMQSLNLVEAKADEGTQANGGLAQTSTKQVSASEKQAERLFEDLVDFRSMRTNYKSSGVASIFSRPKGSGAGGT